MSGCRGEADGATTQPQPCPKDVPGPSASEGLTEGNSGDDPFDSSAAVVSAETLLSTPNWCPESPPKASDDCHVEDLESQGITGPLEHPDSVGAISDRTGAVHVVQEADDESHSGGDGTHIEGGGGIDYDSSGTDSDGHIHSGSSNDNSSSSSSSSSRSRSSSEREAEEIASSSSDSDSSEARHRYMILSTSLAEGPVFGTERHCSATGNFPVGRGRLDGPLPATKFPSTEFPSTGREYAPRQEDDSDDWNADDFTGGADMNEFRDLFARQSTGDQNQAGATSHQSRRRQKSARSSFRRHFQISSIDRRPVEGKFAEPVIQVPQWKRAMDEEISQRRHNGGDDAGPLPTSRSMQLLQTTENHVPCVFEDEVIVARSAATDVGSGNRDDFNFLALAPGTIVEVLPAAGMSQEEANVKEVDATIVQALHAPTEQVGQLVFAVLGPRPSDSVVSSSKALLRSGESPRAALGEVVVRWINGTFDVRVLQRAKETGATVTFDSEPVLHSRLPRSRLRIVSQARKKEIETAEDQAFAVDSDGVLDQCRRAFTASRVKLEAGIAAERERHRLEVIKATKAVAVAAASRNSLQEMHERIELNVKRRYIRDQVQLLQQNTLSSLATGQTSSSMSKGVLSASDNDAVAGGVGSPSNTESKVAADITIVGQRIRFRYGGGALTKWRVAVVASYSSSRKAFLLQFADVGTSINTIEAYQHRSEWVDLCREYRRVQFLHKPYALAGEKMGPH